MDKEYLEDYEEKRTVIVDEEDTSSHEAITTPFSPSDISISNPPMNLGDLIDMIQEGWINFGTDYQREENLWDDIQQSRLIESVLLGLRLPAFYFEEVITKRKWNIIDGLQRCCAIRNFCVDKTLVLRDLEFLNKDFNNKKYSDFDFATRRDIRMLPITVNILAKGVPDMVKYVLFKRLNTGGIPLTNQEIRNAIYSGSAIETIKRMAKSQEFIKATDGKIETLRKTDMDFASRFAAFYVLGWENYKPDLERFINESMETLRDQWKDIDRAKMENDFKRSMDLANKLFGNWAFRRRRERNARRTPLNKAYFEVIGVLLSKLDFQSQSMLLDKKELLMENMIIAMKFNQTYWNSFSGGTGDRNAVKLRFSYMSQIIQMTLNNIKIRITDDKEIAPEKF
jgi:hypothetical protein